MAAKKKKKKKANKAVVATDAAEAPEVQPVDPIEPTIEPIVEPTIEPIVEPTIEPIVEPMAPEPTDRELLKMAYDALGFVQSLRRPNWGVLETRYSMTGEPLARSVSTTHKALELRLSLDG